MMKKIPTNFTLGNKEISIPQLLMVIGAILLVLTLLLPYTTAIGDYAENLKDSPDVEVYDELDMTSGDMINLSMIEYAKVYGNMGDTWILYTVFVVIIGVFALLSLITSIINKPIATIIFTLLSFVVFCMQSWDYTDRGVVPNNDYAWGLAYYLFYIAAVIIIFSAIWTIVLKVQKKKEIQVTNN